MGREGLTLSVVEAGRLLGVGRNTSFRLVREGKIPCLQLGRKMRVPRIAIERLLESACIESARQVDDREEEHE